MPNFIYPQSEEDNAYLNQLNRGTDYGTSATERQGDKMADSTRRQGQIIGNALQEAPSSYMEGARFRSQQDTEEQSRQLRASEEGRAARLFEPQMEGANLENKLRNEDLNQRGIATEEQLHQKGLRRGTDATAAKILGFGPDMSREEMDYAQNVQQGKANLGVTNANIAGIRQNTATGAYDLGQRKVNDMAGGFGPTSGGAPASPAGARDLSVNDMVTAPPAGAVSLTGGVPQVNNLANAPKVAPTSSPEMSDADAAVMAEKINKTTPGANMTPEAVKSAARHIQAQRQAAARQQTVEKEAQAVVTPDIAMARQKAGETAANISKLADMMEQHVKGYDKAAGRGGNSVLGTMAHLVGVNGAGGLIESGEQTRYRHEVAEQLDKMGLHQEAENIMSAKLSSVPSRMQEGIAAAMRKSIGDLKSTVEANGSLQDDRKVSDAVRAANMAIQKYNAQITGKTTLNLTGGGHVSDAVMRGVQ